jgi:hypothetical protein
VTQTLAFPWAAKLAADDLAAFIEDLWGAASGDNNLATLQAIEQAVAKHRPADEAGVPCPLYEVHLSALIDAANGEAPKESARRLGLALPTIYTRRQRACARLNADTVDQAVAICVMNGWITRDHVRLPEPVRGRSATGWTQLYRKRARQLREQPGEWLTTGPYTSRQSALRAAYRIRAGLIRDFKPRGSFEVELARDESVWALRLRFIGDPAQTHERPAS